MDWNKVVSIAAPLLACRAAVGHCSQSFVEGGKAGRRGNGQYTAVAIEDRLRAGLGD